ncbi:unnamed protein product [Schistosoma rodhaini]|uniref:Hepatopoietin-A n=1 Tax=Schistosoma mansoni TaxID=6183 RepID=A0A3Q0KP79_SCHMA|nr:unnamed protein product [Schistosoma rodhaini]
MTGRHHHYHYHHHQYKCFYSLFNILWFFLFIEFIQTIDRTELNELNMYDPMKCRSGNYRGKVNIAFDGTECLDWIDHKSFYKPYWSDDEARKHKNYCRNPGNDSSGPWCVVGIGRFKYCDVPRCAEHIGCYEGNGADYNGDQDQTTDGQPCAKWRVSNSRKDIGPIYRYRLQYNETTSKLLSTSDSELDNFRACRNPGGVKSQPWCYPIKVRGVSSGIQHCDIPKCSDPGTLGYPLFINGSQCMPNFVLQKQFVKLESSTVVVVDYCVAPHGFIYQRHHNAIYNKFKQFCLFLVGKTMYCPAGFIRTRRFQPSLEFIGHLSGPTAWRPTFDNILQIITCCVQPEFWTNSTRTPYISIEKVSQYKGDYSTSTSNNNNNGKEAQELRNIDTTISPFTNEDEDWFYVKPRRRITVGDFFPLRRRKWIARWKRSTFENYTDDNVESEITKSDSSSSSSPITSLYTSETSYTPQSTILDPPLFVSIYQCPPVKGTNRLVAPLFRNVLPDETLSDVLQNLFPEISCEYREAKSEFIPNAETRISQLALLINEPTCPIGFTKTQISRRVVFILGTSISLCWSMTNRFKLDDTSYRNQLPIGNYCLITDHSLNQIKSNVLQESDKEKRYNYKCPQGLRQNEIHFVQVGYRLKLCCSVNLPTNFTDYENESKLDKINYQAPLGITSPFAIIQNGPICPTFYSGNNKLTVVQYNRPIPRPYGDQIELIGPDNPVKLDGIPNIIICQYLNQEIKLGVKSLRYDCDGLGHREVMSYGGATCGFEANSTVVFPPGKYCFLQLSSTCPAGFTSRSGVDRFGFSLQSLGSTCCRTEESIGAIKLPINLEAPFKLPAVYQPCQAIENFNVDAELHHCVYYPKGNRSHIMLVWPRVVSNLNDTINGSDNNKTSVPKYCSKLPGKRVGFRRSQLGRLSALFFNIMQDQWLTYKRPRWTTRISDSSDICFNELNLENIPVLIQPSNGYCISVFGNCPYKFFREVGAAPYMNTVICCLIKEYIPEVDRLNQTSSSSTTSTNSLRVRSFVTLGWPTKDDKKELKNFTGTKVLTTYEQTNSQKYLKDLNYCPQFRDTQLKRRVVESMYIPENVSLSSRLQNKQLFGQYKNLHTLFNVSKSNGLHFESQTGIWSENDIVHVIYCEYGTGKTPGTDDHRNWPVSNYAIPKSLNDCPKGSVKATMRHQQDRYGFHYSQPIHLDGVYFKRKKDILLDYCVFTDDQTAHRTGNYGGEESLPAGHYCVLRVNGNCPADFSEGLLSILEGPEKLTRSKDTSDSSINRNIDLLQQTTTATPDIIRVRAHMKESTSKIDRLNYHFCCRTDSPSVDSPIDGFPAETGPFYLYRVGDKCQQITGMHVTEEYICVDAPNRGDPNWWSIDQNHTWSPYNVKGLTPARVPYHDFCDVEINLCYYEQAAPVSENEVTESYYFQTEWPLGQYALPNVHRNDLDKACPPGFTQHYYSLINNQAAFFELELMPMSLGPYFLELMGHNYSALNVHYCERNNININDEFNNETGEVIIEGNNEGEEEIVTSSSSSSSSSSIITGLLNDDKKLPESQWPKGDYCVISTAENHQCPPGLHRHARAFSELCCRTDNIKDPKPVNWPFIEDFFLFGGEKCLPIKDTHVERYLVRLVSGSEGKHEPQWDVLCHYLPISWMNDTIEWPAGEYMLPIGRRSGLRTSYVTTVAADNDQTNTTATPTNVQDGKNSISGSKYQCPETFERKRFIFASSETEQQLMSNPNTNTETIFNITAYVTMEFCVHTNEQNSSSGTTSEFSTWPAGDYCIFTMNTHCPIGMKASREFPLKIPRFILKSIHSISSDGEIIPNSHWHEDVENHVVYFMQCCREDKTLLLRVPPSKDGFYLASSSGLCSSVPGTVLDREKITTYLTSPLHSNSNAMNNNRKSTVLSEKDMLLYRETLAQREGLLYLCYYHPAKGIDYTTSILGTRYSISQNISEKDIDEIARLCGCAPNAFCLLNKQAECICKPGYYGDGRYVCAPITPLTDECADLCDPSAVCAEHLGVSLKKKQLLSHMCICRPGFVGDGFSCKSDCVARECQPFSRCIHNIPRGITECVCIEGTILSGTRCHLDVYKTLEQEKDLPQFIIDHDHCLSLETQLALRTLNPPKYFYIFVPSSIITSCTDVKEHIVVRSKPLPMNELKYATVQSPIKLITENNTVIEVYPMNGTLMIDGHLAQFETVKFVNGELYYLSNPLKHTVYIYKLNSYVFILITISILIICGLTSLALYKGIQWYRTASMRQFHRLPRQVFIHRAFWKQQTDDILVEETEDHSSS